MRHNFVVLDYITQMSIVLTSKKVKISVAIGELLALTFKKKSATEKVATDVQRHSDSLLVTYNYIL